MKKNSDRGHAANFNAAQVSEVHLKQSYDIHFVSFLPSRLVIGRGGSHLNSDKYVPTSRERKWGIQCGILVEKRRLLGVRT